MNKVYIIGRIARDLEIKFFGKNNTRSYIQFPLAVNEYSSSTKEQKCNFINIVAFDRKAEIINEFLKKGKLISIEGHLKNHNYINNNNQKVYNTSVILDNFEFIGKKTDA
ncbi:MAG: single-stranded DNA-binding protein [Clostridium butyricum]|nr:single-stranded DNA-binding protein [Clostridium butyricum]